MRVVTSFFVSFQQEKIQMPLLAAANYTFSFIAPVTLGCLNLDSGRSMNFSVTVLILVSFTTLLSSVTKVCLNLLSVKEC